MNSNGKPADFLAELTPDFVPKDGETRTVFHDLHSEACLELSEHFPNMRKRKIQGNALPLTLFKQIKRKVTMSTNDSALAYYVEAFKDEKQFLQTVVKELEECIELEEKMTSGKQMTSPEFLLDDDIDIDNETPNIFDIDTIVEKACEILEDKSAIDQSKIIKIFESNHKASIGIYHPGLKKEAANKGINLPKIPTPKNYPTNVTSGVKMFTKPTATGTTGKTNVITRVCILVEAKFLKPETVEHVKELLGVELPSAENDDPSGEGDVDDSEGFVQSQDFPGLFQSQTTEIVINCDLCVFSSRQKHELEEHMKTHPRCNLCNLMVANELELTKHIKEFHEIFTACEVCQKDVPMKDMQEHMRSHELTERFRNADNIFPDKTKKKKQQGKENAPTKTKNSFFIFCDEKRPILKAQNPGISPSDLTKMVSILWKAMSDNEKEAYKIKADQLKRKASDTCPFCHEPTEDLRGHIEKEHMGHQRQNEQVVTLVSSATSATSSRDENQSTITQCPHCACPFISLIALSVHIKDVHGTDNENMESDDNENLNEPQNVSAPIVVSSPEEENVEEVDEFKVNDIVYVKLRIFSWPAKIISVKDGHSFKVKMYDAKKSVKQTDITNIKKFHIVDEFPDSLPKGWKVSYENASKDFSQLDK